MIFINGEFLPASEASVLVTDRGFLFGDGVFTTIKVANRQIEFFQSHCERFALHCNVMNIFPPRIDLTDVLKLIDLNDAYKGTWRLKIIATAKSRQGELTAMRDVGSYVMLLEPYTPPREFQNGSCSLWAYPTPVESPLSCLKSLGCASRFFILDEAYRHGYDDALLTNSEGFITETAFANFFWRQGSDLFTPSPKLPLMSGIALMFVEMVAKTLHLNWHEVKMAPAEIPLEAQLFVCNSMIGIVPVSVCNGNTFMRDLFFENGMQYNYREMIKFFSMIF